MAELRQLSEDVAQALLEAIKDAATRYDTGEHLHGLAQAYVAVAGSMPKKSASPRSGPVVDDSRQW